MDFEGFDWDEGNTDKCKRHGVPVQEVEDFLTNGPFITPDPFATERRYRAVGRTAAGRPLFVVFTWRVIFGERLLRPISARYMHSKEIEAYEQQKEVPRI